MAAKGLLDGLGAEHLGEWQAGPLEERPEGIVAQRDVGTLRLFVDGALRAESRLPDGRFLHADSPEPLLIGCGQQGSFLGSISDVRIYDGLAGVQDIV